jgi:GrpE
MFFKKFFSSPKEAREKQAQDLVLKIEARVRQLSHLSSVSQEFATDIDLISVLTSVNLLLDRLVDNPELVKTSPNLALEKQTIPEKETPTISSEPQLSETATELIKLRDWVLLAKTGNNIPSSELLDALYQQLGQVLEKEGVIVLEEGGRFNYEYQQVMSINVTDEEDKHDIVSETVRPGYIFNGNVVRQQEVIIYRFQPLLIEDTLSSF